MNKTPEMNDVMIRNYKQTNICYTCTKAKNGTCAYANRIKRANEIYEKVIGETKSRVVAELGPNPYEGSYGSMVMSYKPIVNCNAYSGIFEHDGRYPREIIVMSGSSRFKEDFDREEERLTLAGNVVLSLGVFSKYTGLELTKEQKDQLFLVHIEKILMADRLYVINKDGYIGDSTCKEIEFAKNLGIKISYMEEEKSNTRVN